MRRIALLALTVLAAASCEKHDLDTSDLQLTLNGKPYALQEQNTLSGLPGTTFDFNVTGKRNTGLVTRGGLYTTSQVKYDPETGKGTFHITIGDIIQDKETIRLIYSSGKNNLTYYFDINVQEIRYDVPETATCTGEAGAQTEIPFAFQTTADNPKVSASFESDTYFEIVSFSYAPSGEDGLYKGTVVIRTKKENADGSLYTDVLNIRHDMEHSNKRGSIRVQQISLDPVPVEGMVYFRDWNLKRTVNALLDDDGDGEITFAQALTVTRLDLSNKGIKSLEGLDAFKHIEWLDISYNEDLGDVPLDDPGSYSHLKYVRAMFGKPSQRIVNCSGCYFGPSWTIETTERGRVDYNHPKYYKSDPNRVPRLTKIKEHTKGPGKKLSLVYKFNLVDIEFESGALEEYIQLDLERIFSVAPIDYFKDYFDVYILENVLVDNAEKEVSEWIFGPYDEPGIYEKTIYPETGRGLAITISNPERPYYIFGQYLGESSTGLSNMEFGAECTNSHGRSTILIGEGRSRLIKHEEVLIHELGHSLGNLLDQYPTVAFRHEEMNMESNISVTGKPDEVPWRRFFSVEKYKDKVGIFQHAKNKEYYPSDPQTSKNVMCDTQNEFKYFDSVGRWCIFRNIMWYTDQVVDPEEAWPLFLEYDVVNDNLPD